MKSGKYSLQNANGRAAFSRLAAMAAGVALVWAWLSLGCFPALGQGTTGHIVGTIRDSSNAVVPNASIVISNQDTGLVTRTTTNSVGEYRSDNLPPGTYQVAVEAQGFSQTVSRGNIVTVDNSNRVDISLSIGAANQTVNVTGDNQLIDTTGSSLGEVLSAQDVMNLPLNGRIFSQLIVTVPGAPQL